jgi:hypothetical protein
MGMNEAAKFVVVVVVVASFGQILCRVVVPSAMDGRQGYLVGIATWALAIVVAIGKKRKR